MAITIGQHLGFYEVTALLGKGGRGEVYLAQDVKLGRRVALKFLKTNLAFGPEQIRDLLNEARAAAALCHPNVATVYEVSEVNGVHFIVMEYVEGETLKTKIANNSLSQKDLHSFATQIIGALEAAHLKGVVHSDLKSANIMVTPRGQVKLLDFGLAKRFNVTHSCISDSTVTEIEAGLLAGTLDYMSPEQALGQNIDHRSDIFSLGVVLYEAATGCLPFTGLTPIETINRIINLDPRPIADLSPSIPTSFRKIISRCLVKKPEGRYQSAGDILEDLTKSRSTSCIESVSSVRNNLPNQLTNFIGREREITAVKQLLAKTRILTLAGTGGIGKTRLALSVAIEKLDDYPDGVWFVDLSTLSDASQVASAIATSQLFRKSHTMMY